jgi:hypothetical protein
MQRELLSVYIHKQRARRKIQHSGDEIALHVKRVKVQIMENYPWIGISFYRSNLRILMKVSKIFLLLFLILV